MVDNFSGTSCGWSNNHNFVVYICICFVYFVYILLCISLYIVAFVDVYVCIYLCLYINNLKLLK